MSDYIKRGDVLELARKGFIISNGNFKSVVQFILEIPAADVIPAVHGHGDLIEKSAIEKAINDACAECKEACIEFDGFFADCDQCIFHDVKKALVDAPTIIPAEEGE